MRKGIVLFITVISIKTLLAAEPSVINNTAIQVVEHYTQGLEQALVLHHKPNIELYSVSLASLVMTGRVPTPQQQPQYAGRFLENSIRAGDYGIATHRKATDDEKAILYKALDALKIVRQIQPTFINAVMKVQPNKPYTAHQQAALRYYTGERTPYYELLSDLVVSSVRADASYDKSTYNGVIYVKDNKAAQSWNASPIKAQHPWIKAILDRTAETKDSTRVVGQGPQHQIDKTLERLQQAGVRDEILKDFFMPTDSFVEYAEMLFDRTFEDHDSARLNVMHDAIVELKKTDSGVQAMTMALDSYSTYSYYKRSRVFGATSEEALLTLQSYIKKQQVKEDNLKKYSAILEGSLGIRTWTLIRSNRSLTDYTEALLNIVSESKNAPALRAIKDAITDLMGSNEGTWAINKVLTNVLPWLRASHVSTRLGTTPEAALKSLEICVTRRQVLEDNLTKYSQALQASLISLKLREKLQAGSSLATYTEALLDAAMPENKTDAATLQAIKDAVTDLTLSFEGMQAIRAALRDSLTSGQASRSTRLGQDPQVLLATLEQRHANEQTAEENLRAYNQAIAAAKVSNPQLKERDFLSALLGQALEGHSRDDVKQIYATTLGQQKIDAWLASVSTWRRSYSSTDIIGQFEGTQ